MGNYTPNPFMTQPAHLPPLLTINNLSFKFCCESEHCAKSPGMVCNKVARRVRWEKPNHGWVRLNSDGSSDFSG